MAVWGGKENRMVVLHYIFQLLQILDGYKKNW